MQKLIILSYPRTGSTLLGDILCQHPSIFYAGEIFHRNDDEHDVQRIISLFDKRITLKNFESFSSKLMQRFNKKVFAFKLFSQPAHILTYEGIKTAVATPNTKVIFLYRKNMLRAYVSYFKAMKTREWHIRIGECNNDQKRIPQKTTLKIKDVEMWINNAMEMMQRIENKVPITNKIRVYYEDLVDEIYRNSSLKKIYTFLSISNFFNYKINFNRTTSELDYSYIYNKKELESYFNYRL